MEKIGLEKEIDFKKIEKKWQERWEKEKAFQVKEDSKKEKYYVLEMFPYPSASYLHMGHVRNYAMGDVIARFKRMKGFNVLYPMGYDSFGLPAENAAKKEGIHPKKYTEKAIAKIMEYQKKLGNSYDWNRMVATHTPEYYKWNQYFFIKFLEKGLVYRKKAPVNWCPSCKTVLANEEVVSGKCWRCDSVVETKDLEQWFFKITKYADELLKDLEKLEWSEQLKTMQRNWIGKSEGVDIFFPLENSKKVLSAFTTRCDTIFSVTFLAVAPESPLVEELVKGTKYEKQVREFINKVEKEKIEDRINEEKEKEGVFTGKYAINPTTNEKIPIYVSNFAVMYGTGVVMCDAHDKRDFRFARKYNIPLKFVISKDGKHTNPKNFDDAFVDDGILFDSGKFSGMNNKEALPKMAEWLEKNKLGKRTTNFKIKDWLISRQRYWGTPIPIIYCDKCGIVPVSEKELPVLLPEDVEFKEKGNPILTSKKFQDVKCPKCKSKARRETDTMGGFMDSSWYFLRYCDSKNDKKPFAEEKVKYWMPVDQYVGGIEHAVGHLIYSRFFTKALRDLGFLKIDEPFTRLFNQGIVYKDGKRMSKSSGNTVTQEEVSNKYGIDAARIFLLFVASPESNLEWNDEGIEGVYRFVKRIFEVRPKEKTNEKSEHYRNKFIKEITGDIENFRFNLALIKLMKWANMLQDKCDKNSFEDFLKMLSAFAPHIAEELWEKLGNKKIISLESWPKYDDKKINEKFEKAEQAVEKTVSDILNILKIVKEKQGKEGSKIYLYVIPNEKEFYNKEELSTRVGKPVEVFAVNDKSKYDPENKSGKAKPGKPGVFVE